VWLGSDDGVSVPLMISMSFASPWTSMRTADASYWRDDAALFASMKSKYNENINYSTSSWRDDVVPGISAAEERERGGGEGRGVHGALPLTMSISRTGRRLASPESSASTATISARSYDLALNRTCRDGHGVDGRLHHLPGDHWETG
jgi:hypothetical protein